MVIGFIGLGNMASAMVRGIAAAQLEGVTLCGHNPHPEKAKELAEQCGLRLLPSNQAVLDASDVVVLAVQRVLLRPSKEKEPQSYSPLVQAIARQSGDKAAREAADRLDTRRDMRDRMAHSLSFGLLMTCLGLCVILTVVICHVF